MESLSIKRFDVTNWGELTFKTVRFLGRVTFSSQDILNDSFACTRLEEFKNREYDVVVLKKYIDESNHQFKTIALNKRKTMVLARDTSAFYDFIQPNDSIVKKKGTDMVTVYRLKTVSKFKIYFGCTEK